MNNRMFKNLLVRNCSRNCQSELSIGIRYSIFNHHHHSRHQQRLLSSLLQHDLFTNHDLHCLSLIDSSKKKLLPNYTSHYCQIIMFYNLFLPRYMSSGGKSRCKETWLLCEEGVKETSKSRIGTKNRDYLVCMQIKVVLQDNGFYKRTISSTGKISLLF